MANPNSNSNPNTNPSDPISAFFETIFKVAESEVKGQMADVKNDIAAKEMKKIFDSYIRAGFNEHQALQIVVAMIGVSGRR